MIFQFGIVAIGMICGTVLVLAGHPEAGFVMAGGSGFIFMVSML